MGWWQEDYDGGPAEVGDEPFDLVRLGLGGTRVSDDGVARLLRVLPSTEIQR